MNRLRSTREKCGLSLAQAAKLLGWDQQALDEHETEHETSTRYPLTDNEWRRIASIYHCSVAWLRGEAAELSDKSKEFLNQIDHTSDRAVVRDFMEMLSTRDPGEPEPVPPNERLAKIAEQMRKPGMTGRPADTGSDDEV